MLNRPGCGLYSLLVNLAEVYSIHNVNNCKTFNYKYTVLLKLFSEREDKPKIEDTAMLQYNDNKFMY